MKTLSLDLNSMDELFVAPEEDLFADDDYEVLGQSGIQWVLKYFGPRWREKEDYRLIIRLPAEQIQADTQARVRKAIQRYCQLHITDNISSRQRAYRGGFWLLLMGIGFLIVCMILAYVFYNDLIVLVAGNLNHIIGEGFIIIGWISLWHPAETLLFDWIPFVRENQLYRFIMSMEILVEPWQASATPPLIKSENTPG
jgi:hypothetical protein